MTWINTVPPARAFLMAMVRDQWPSDKWLPVSIAPFDTDLEVCVIDKQGIHPLVFPCRRTAAGWADTAGGRPLDIAPTHWRKWSETRAPG